MAFHGAVTPVPTGWTIGDDACGQPHSNTVVLMDQVASAACGAGRAPHVSDVRLWRLDSPYLDKNVHQAAHEIRLNDGTAALIRRQPSDSPVGYTTTTLVVPALNLAAIGTSPHPHMLDGMLRAISGMPADWVRVPSLRGVAPNAAKQRLHRLGLNCRLMPASRPPAGAYVAQTIPRSLLAVPTGSTVTVRVRTAQ